MRTPQSAASTSHLVTSLMVLAAALAATCGCEIITGPPAATGGSGEDVVTDAGAGAGTDTGTDTDAATNGNAGGASSGIVADHSAAADFDSIPDESIDAAKSDYRIFYGHTSHGGQIITGMEMISAEDSRYAFNSGSDTLSIEENEADLGSEGDLTWVDTTRDVLNRPGSDINMVMWSWCGGVSGSTEGEIDAYLNAMNQLESDFPNVVFVYMTGHLDGTGPDGDLHVRNNQIRAYCRANDKILFDFADIESYDPDGNHYPYGTDWCEWCEEWCATHTCPSCDECEHSVCFNCYQKGKAFWWMMARIAGWSGS